MNTTTQADAINTTAHNTEVFEGHLTVGDTRISVSFDVPIGASQTQKDAAFIQALPEDDDILVLEYLSMGTMHKDEPPQMLYWAITGRIPGDEEDSLYVMQAPNREEAEAAFVAAIWADEPGDEKSREEAKQNVLSRHGQLVYMNSVICSQTPITEC